MSNTIETLRQKIKSAKDLQSVVHTMKTLAASQIGQYENAVRSLGEYYRTVELGLHVCLRGLPLSESAPDHSESRFSRSLQIVIFGSDQGLVGQFNDRIVQHAITALSERTESMRVWAIGERVYERLEDAGMKPLGVFQIPSSIQSITPVIGQILLTREMHSPQDMHSEFHLFYHRTTSSPDYDPVHVRLLPLDQYWHEQIVKQTWPSRCVPELMGSLTTQLPALIREYLFVSLYRACVESLASENAFRLAAMQRADQNIQELLENLTGTYHRLRQAVIDEELFDVIAGFEALNHDMHSK